MEQIRQELEKLIVELLNHTKEEEYAPDELFARANTIRILTELLLRF